MEGKKTFEEKKHDFLQFLGNDQNVTGGAKDDGTTLDDQGRTLRGIKKMNDPEENMGENIKKWAKRIWNTKTPTLDNEKSGSCEIDRDGGM